MNIYKTYTLGLCLLLAGVCPLAAQQEKNTYNMDRLKADNPWIGSSNASGLVLNRFNDFSTAEVGFQYDEGGYRNVADPTSAFNTKVNAESFRHIKRVFFYGNFNFDYINRQNKTWSSILNPYGTPFYVADSVPGIQTLESYRLEGGVSTTLGEHWGIGGMVRYLTASNAKKKDVRNRNTYMEFEIYPGILYRSKNINAGANFIYQRMTEKMENTLHGEGRNHDVFYFEGLWFYTTITTASNYSETRQYQNDGYGAAAQIEVKGGNIRFFNQFSGVKTDQIVWINHVTNQRGGETEKTSYRYDGALHIDGSDFHHVIKGNAAFEKRLGYENLQRYESVDNYNTWVQYGKKNKNTRDITSYGLTYTLFKDRKTLENNWNVILGVNRYEEENEYRLYPVNYAQTWENTVVHGAFNKNFRVKKGMVDAGIYGAYTLGDGTMLSITSESAGVSGEDLFPQRREQLEREFEYFTADRLAGRLHLRYTHFLNTDKGMNLYADVEAGMESPSKGYFKQENRSSFKVMLGFSF